MKPYHYILPIMLMLLAGCAISCTGNGDEPAAAAQEASLRINIGILSRGSRAGEANGYGYEYAVRQEDRIDNITVFFYRNAAGPNDDARFIASYFVPRRPDGVDPDGTQYYEISLESIPFTDGDGVMVVCNMGDLSNLRDMAALRAATAEAFQRQAKLSEYNRFAMSTCRDDGGRLYAASEPARYAASTTVERLAARFDIWLDHENIAGDYLAYTVRNSNDRVYITGLTLVNLMRQDTYVLKHLSEGFDISRTIVCGKELLGDDGLPANYVVEPTTSIKGSADALDLWYGETRASALTEASFIPVADYLNDNLTQPTSGEHSLALTIGYGSENTYTASQADSRHTTGLAMRALYVPEGMEAGSDFWRVRRADLALGEDHVFSTESEARQYVAAHPGYLEPILYRGGICYYNFWFRHRLEKSSDDLIYPMEFGTVRNHIYRAGFSFSAIGTPDINIEDPEQHIAELYVRRWNFRRLNSIIM